MNQAPLAIFLSPHLDDIPLSCGGIAARLSRQGAHCIALAIFTAPATPDVPLSPFAHLLHSQWESAAGESDANNASRINEVRREEERQALRLLGLEPVWLDLLDAVYRRGTAGEYFYASREALMEKANVAAEERCLLAPSIAREIERVAKETGARGKVRVFAPLGVGRHVDHQVAFLATRRLGPRYGVLYYEDYPYAGKEGALQARLEELSSTLDLPIRSRLTSIADLIGVKIASIARYKSQLNNLFGSAEEMPSAVRGYAQSVAGTSSGLEYAERYWYIPPAYRIGT